MRDFYLNILGLKNGASSDEIKRAYRKKAFEYHPDKNSSPTAEKMFLLINDAYEALSQLESTFTNEGEKKEEQTDDFNKKYHRKLTKEELEERLKLARAERIRKFEKENNILNISLLELEDSFILKLSNWIATLSLFFALILFADLYLLQPNIELGIVNKFDEYYNGQQIHIKLNENNEDIIIATSLDDINFQVIRNNYLVELYRTPIFKEVAYVRNFSHRKVKPMVNHTSFNSIFGIIFCLFFLPIINFVFKGANSFYIIFVHLNIGFPIIGLIIFLSYLII